MHATVDQIQPIVQLTLQLQEGEGGILCQFGVASPRWGILQRWFDRGCREVVVSSVPHPGGQGQHLARDAGATCIFLTDRGVHQVLLPVDGHPELNNLSDLWIWPLEPLPSRLPASLETRRAASVPRS